MKSQVSDQKIDFVLAGAKAIAEKEGEELTEEHVRKGIAKMNLCGSSCLDQCWYFAETDEFRASTDRATYDVELTERFIERFRALFPQAQPTPTDQPR